MTPAHSSTATAGSTPTRIAVGRDPLAWVGDNLADLRAELDAAGALLLTGLDDVARERFDVIVGDITSERSVDYTSGATPRRALGGAVYSSTEFDRDHRIDLHSEMAYASTWPVYLGFCSVVPAESGGATPIASTAEILDGIPDGLRSRVQETGIAYTRTFTSVLGGDWRAVYGTDDQDRARAVASSRGESLFFHGDDARSRTVLPATLDVDGVARWFNQMVAFNVATLPDDVRDDLVAVVGLDNVPKNTTSGDGAPFGRDDIEAVRAAVDRCAVVRRWDVGDLLVIDNRRWGHGRAPYSGARDLRVCMTGRGDWAPASTGDER